MAKFFIAAVVLVAVLLWRLIVTMLMRLFGIHLPLQPFGRDRKRASQLLTFSQSVSEGVLVLGCGLFIAMTLFEYFAWKYWNAPARDFSLRIRVYAIVWPAYGLLMGRSEGVITESEVATRRCRRYRGVESATAFHTVGECNCDSSSTGFLCAVNLCEATLSA